jgi:gliding motility-associated peptidyl-prolyl isomerase
MLRKLLYIFCFAISAFSCKSPEARKPVQSHTGSFIKESASRNKKIYDREKDYIQKIIATDTTKDYISSPNGFWYYYNKRDTTATKRPDVGDIVKFTYNIKDLNGNLVLSEKENGLQQYKVDKSHQELISGVREGIKLMKEGETVTFLFPSYKAYGYYGIQEKLGTNVPVQSTITLHSIEHSNKN